MAVDARYRDKDGEISRKHGNTLIGRLRVSYGSGFAKGCANDEKLSDVLAKLDGQSLSKLVRDHKAGIASGNARGRGGLGLVSDLSDTLAMNPYALTGERPTTFDIAVQ